MSKILCCWELGEELDHLGQFYPVINELLRCGHQVYFIVKDLTKARTFNWDDSVVFLQAPIWLPRLLKEKRVIFLARLFILKMPNDFQCPEISPWPIFLKRKFAIVLRDLLNRMVDVILNKSYFLASVLSCINRLK